MINVEDLLKPVSDDKPCGEDFTYHPSFQNLETLARGKSETQFSPAEEPEWKEVASAAVEVLSQSKHLGAAVTLTRALLKQGGLEGLCDGLAVVHGLTQMYWPDVFPKLDPEDNNDPTERLNILNYLSSPKFTLAIGEVVLCNSPTMGRITLQQYLASKEKAEKTGGSDSAGGLGPDPNQIKAAFQDAGPGPVKATLVLLETASGHAAGIESFLETTLGAGRGVNFDSLNKLFSEMKRAVEPYAGNGAAAAQPDVADLGASSGRTGDPSASRGRPGVSGTIQTRADVIKALDLICDFYREHEPSSPVPLILRRAHRLVDKDFVAILSDLTPEALAQLKVITGPTTDK